MIGSQTTLLTFHVAKACCLPDELQSHLSIYNASHIQPVTRAGDHVLSARDRALALGYEKNRHFEMNSENEI